MPPSDFATADIDKVLNELTTDEAILLSAGVGFWYTHSIDRLGIPAIKFSDGPNGIRGKDFSMGLPAKCLPSATALGATWDTSLVEQATLKILAQEAKLRAASLVLAPTCNIQRNPLGGRSFESFSEDPFLSGMMAASFVNGIQKGGIGTTIKHFVANDKEDDRHGYNSVISARALREIYLMPFMLAQKYAQPWSYMTAYNRVNGLHASENPFLLKKILRDEWKFEGMIMSDLFGIFGVDHALNAGVDLEIPGVGKWRTIDYVNRSILARKVTAATIKQRAKKVLELVQKCAQRAPEILDGDGLERKAESDDDDKIFMRKVASESIVLLRNEGDVLPLNPQKLKKIAIIGPNAKAFLLSGGGSAALKPSYFVTTYDGIVSALEQAGYGTEVTYSEGTRAYKSLPSLDYDIFTPSGERGWICSWHCHVDDSTLVPQDEVLESNLIDETRIFVCISTPQGITRNWTVKMRGYLKPRPYDCIFEFGLKVAGRAKLFVDGQLVIDNWTRQRHEPAFYGLVSEKRGTFKLKANIKHEILVVFCNILGPAGDEDDPVIKTTAGVVQLGGVEVQDSDELLEQAVDLAKDADAVIAVVGLNDDWEIEGVDRTTLALPGRTDELIARVAAANAKTVVVTHAGSAITMPWVDLVPAIVHAWYLGNASGDAIADVLFGKQNPSGKLSLTFPKAEEDVPSYGHFHSENGEIRYAEDLYVGYKHYQHRKIVPLFAFGHGLSYTKFSLSNLQLSEAVISGGEFRLAVSLTVENVGNVTGSEVVQVYVSLPATSGLTHPMLQLKGFAKVRDLVPGGKERRDVEVVLDKYAVSYWNDVVDAWMVEKGVYRVEVGTGSDCLSLGATFEVVKGFEWSGL